ncbi:MAG: ribosome maturation factor RimP [Oscillospiraceae bacterium]|nr:ribosome maturation factor RimP [Oscillospiraceae bacterium]
MDKKGKKTKGSNKPKPKKQIEQIAKSLIEPELSALGYDIWDIEYYDDGTGWTLEITIENPSGAPISFEDCDKATRAICPILDLHDPIENSYCLAVGSPGLDRQLKTAAHMDRYKGKKVKVGLFAKNETVGAKSFVGILKTVGDAESSFEFELVPGGEAISLEKKQIAQICAHDEIEEIKTQ